MGTFGMTLSSYKDTNVNNILSANTTTLGIDPLARGGTSRMLLTFDHRVLDGVPTIKVCSKIDQTLNGPILEEMKQILKRQEASTQEN